MSDVYLLSAVRTAIGTFGGSLKDIAPTDLAAQVTREALSRAGVDPARVGHVVFGQVIQTEAKDAYVARVAAVNAGIPHRTPAMTVNRLCGSGLQAVLSAANTIQLGENAIAVGGGVEVMSRAPFLSPAMRWGKKLGDSVLIDMLNGALTDPFGNGIMGVTAENVAKQWEVSREDQDLFAHESQLRYQRAHEAGKFADEIVGVEIEKGKNNNIAVGELNTSRDYTDVRDIVRAYRLLLENGKESEVYNVCSGKALSGNELLERLLNLSNINPEIEIDKKRIKL